MSYPLGVRMSRAVTESDDMAVHREWFRVLKEIGYDFIDVMELTGEVKQAASEAGLAIGSFDVKKVPQLFSKDERKRDDAVEAVCRQIADAAAWGGTVCFMCLKPEDNAMPRRESLAIYKDVFPTIAAAAEQCGVKVIYEGFPGPAPYYPTLGCTPETLRAMLEAVPSPALCVNYDPSHLIRLGIDHMRFLREFVGQTAHVHAKDCVIDPENAYLYGRSQAPALGYDIKHSEGAWRYTIPGEGTVNWAAVAFELEKAGYQGLISVELEDHRYKAMAEDRMLGLVKSFAHLKAAFR